LTAPSDEFVLARATSRARYPHGRSEAGAAIPRSALHDRCELHELFEARESGVVNRRILEGPRADRRSRSNRQTRAPRAAVRRAQNGAGIAVI